MFGVCTCHCLYNGTEDTDAAIQVLPSIVTEALDSYNPSPLPRVSDEPPSEIMELTHSATPALLPSDAPTEESNEMWMVPETESKAENYVVADIPGTQHIIRNKENNPC